MVLFPPLKPYTTSPCARYQSLTSDRFRVPAHDTRVLAKAVSPALQPLRSRIHIHPSLIISARLAVSSGIHTRGYSPADEAIRAAPSRLPRARSVLRKAPPAVAEGAFSVTRWTSWRTG